MIDGSDETRQQRKRRSAGLELAGRLRGGRANLVGLQLVEPILPRPQHSHMGPIELVTRAHQGVDAERRDIDALVRHQVDGIHIGAHPGSVERRDHSGQIGDGPECIRTTGDTQQLRLWPHQGGEGTDVEADRIRVDVEPIDLDAAVGSRQQPWCDIGVVVDPGQDDPIAGPE